MIMIARGNRSRTVTDSCRKHGGFYLGSIGGPAALLAQEHIKEVEVIDYEDLGMEAVYRIEVADVPAFILIDDKRNDFSAQLPVIAWTIPTGDAAASEEVSWPRGSRIPDDRM